ncbi:MAG: flagellar filament capping protein FliD [Lachnospiraceae bacterium]|nr:flagellar filament capping protein FliD [Lachnospiraceae bacterium]
MSDLLRMTGMYSGMDTESIVSQLVKTKSTKVTNLKNEQKKLEWKQTAWQDLNSKIYNMYSKTLSNLRLTSAYSKKSTVSSDSTKATVVASEGAVNGTQTLKVNKLAKSGYLTGAKLDGKTTTTTGTDGKDVTKVVNWETTDKLSEIDSNLTGKTISITTGSGTDAKTTDIEITADMTINDLVAKFKDAGVNASFDTTNQRFFINSTGTGSAKNFTLTSDDSTALASLGLDPNTTYTDINGSKNSCVKIEGQDAEIVLNGATFVSDSNTFSINGLTINTLGVTDEEISLVTSTDYDGIYNTIKDFLTEYNDLINEMDKLYNADSARKYDMLTNDEKDSMTDDEVEQWEDKIKSALLRKDNSLYNVMNTLTTTMMDGYYENNLSDKQKKNMSASEISAWYKENGGKKHYLSDYGIGTLSYFEAQDNEHHAYHINGDADDEFTSTKEDKLKAAIAEDPEGTANFFATLCKTLYSKLDETMSESTEYSSIYKVYNDKQLKKDYKDYTTKISDAEDELNDYEDRWYNKFSKMEVALSKLQSQTSSISSMLGSN